MLFQVCSGRLSRQLLQHVVVVRIRLCFRQIFVILGPLHPLLFLGPLRRSSGHKCCRVRRLVEVASVVVDLGCSLLRHLVVVQGLEEEVVVVVGVMVGAGAVIGSWR